MSGALTSTLMGIVPLPLLATGLVVGVRSDQHAELMRRTTKGAASLALLLAVAAAVTFSMGSARSETYLAVALPLHLQRLEVATDVNTLTVAMLLLVSFVGTIVARFSATYMVGDGHEGRFHRRLSLTLGSFLTLIISGNMWMFMMAWVATSLFLHELLAFYRDRPGAVLAARKKYVLHRISDASLLAAFWMTASAVHSAQFSALQPALAARHGSLSPSLQVAAGLIALSAILKSAQFPFHGWLIEVMEAPTPVSALLHAGIIYTGTFLILRTLPIMSKVGWTGFLLVLVGLLSIAAASLMMVTTSNIKGSLAYSTCAQMGFMLMECGLGLYSLAVLHIVAHSVYKAHAFLSSGSVVEYFRAPKLPPVATATTVWRGLLGLAVAVGMTVVAGALYGIDLARQPALMVMGVILAVGITQLLLLGMSTHSSSTRWLPLFILGLSALVALAYFGLHTGVTALLSDSLPTGELPAGPARDALLLLIVAVFLTLLAVQQLLPRMYQRPFWKGLYVNLYNGFYIDMLFTHTLSRFGRTGRVAVHQPALAQLQKVQP